MEMGWNCMILAISIRHQCARPFLTLMVTRGFCGIEAILLRSLLKRVVIWRWLTCWVCIVVFFFSFEELLTPLWFVSLVLWFCNPWMHWIWAAFYSLFLCYILETVSSYEDGNSFLLQHCSVWQSTHKVAAVRLGGHHCPTLSSAPGRVGMPFPSLISLGSLPTGQVMHIRGVKCHGV
jgi:hypothetical protein